MTATYTDAFKEQALRKVFQRGNKTILTVAQELNMTVGTLKNWMKTVSKTGAKPLGSGKKRPLDWSLSDRLNALLDSHPLSGDALQSWCREKGVFSHQLVQWRTDFCRPTTSEDSQRLRALSDENKRLERELNRKEKALAEAAALLVLQKKFHALLGGEVA